MVKVCDHRKTAYDLRNESIRTKVLSLNILKKVILVDFLLVLCSETDHLSIEPLRDPALDALECTSADEKDVLSVHVQELLLRMLSTSLWRHIDHTAFKQLQHRLLNSLSGHVPCNGRIVALARDLVDLIDEHDTSLCLGNIVVSLLEKS